MSDAMEAHPERFDSAYCSLVAAGESGGNLGDMLERLADLKRKQLLLRNSIVGAMVYPCLLLCVALVVSTVMLTLVVPRFSDLFKSLDVPLPASTKVLVAVSGLVQSYWWAMLLVAGGSALGLRSWLGSPSGKYARDTFVLRIPKLGSIVKSFAVARMTRLLGVLLDSHVNILKALSLTKQSANNVHYKALIAKAQDLVSRGEPICSAFCDTDLVSPTVSEAIRNGERTGKLSLLLLYVADFLDDENEIIMRSLASIIEPVILVVLGLLVGAVAISLFTPLFDLGSMAQGGGT
jgi:type II secretory pathway component PulF